ncbi:MAG: NfeD family protein [Tepidiformaceae bacterium]
MRALSRTLLAFGLLFVGLAAACGNDSRDDAVHVLTIDGGIGPITERYIDRGIGRAEDNQGKLVIIEMDTPGGLSTSMRDIVKRIQRANVPVAVYVTPPGGQAASAGTFITLAAHIAVMAPQTNIGAAAAINSDGSDIDGTLGKKIENNDAAFIRGLAEARGRNADWAERAVREAISATATQAVELNVVDFIAENRQGILAVVEGTSVELRPGTRVELRGLLDAPVVETKMTAWERFLDILADPTLASILISIGFLGLVFELANPGLILPGVAGAVAMLLGFLGFGVLPVETAGLVLIFLALVFFALELFVPSGGILGAGGLVALVLGGIIAFRDTPAEFRPPIYILIILGILIGGLFFSLAVGVARLRKLTSEAGTGELIGKVAIARTPLTPEGFVFIQGERWKAELDGGSATTGDRVRIVGAEGLRLRVHREDDP